MSIASLVEDFVRKFLENDPLIDGDELLNYNASPDEIKILVNDLITKSYEDLVQPTTRVTDQWLSLADATSVEPVQQIVRIVCNRLASDMAKKGANNYKHLFFQGNQPTPEERVRWTGFLKLLDAAAFNTLVRSFHSTTVDNTLPTNIAVLVRETLAESNLVPEVSPSPPDRNPTTGTSLLASMDLNERRVRAFFRFHGGAWTNHPGPCWSSLHRAFPTLLFLYEFLLVTLHRYGQVHNEQGLWDRDHGDDPVKKAYFDAPLHTAIDGIKDPIGASFLT